MRILFLGDIVGKPGRDLIYRRLPQLRRQYGPDFVVANAENAAGGAGITGPVAEDLFRAGIDCLTLGNHAWDRPQVAEYIDGESRLIRPLNYPPGTPGSGMAVITGHAGRLGVINAQGRVFSPQLLDDPFRLVEQAVADLRDKADAILVDFHAEATSEKQAMGWFLDGRVSAVIGTHTHVPTADAVVLPGGTAYMTDVGMNGPWQSVIGMNKDRALERFLTQLPVRLEVAQGPVFLSAVLVEVREDGLAVAITPIAERELDQP